MKNKRIWISFIVLSLLCLTLTISTAQDLKIAAQHPQGAPYFLDKLEVGIATANITPDESLVLGGYGIYFGNKKNCRWSKDVHDSLLASALYMVKADITLVLLELDLVGLVTSDINDIRESVARKLAISTDNVIVACSHTHHSPDTIGLWGTIIPPFSGRNEDYLKFVKEKAVQAAILAFEDKAEAKLFYNVGEEADLHFNTYSEKVKNAPIDHTITILKAVDNDGKVIATMTNWGCHPTTENGENRYISSDWVGPFRDVLKNEFGGEHIFINGSIGAAIQPSIPWQKENLNGDGQGFVWAKAMGETLAKKVVDLINNAKPLEVKKIVIQNRPVMIPMKNFAFSLAKSSGNIKLSLPPYGAEYTTGITSVQLGALRIGTVPGEISANLGNDVRKELKGDAQIIVGLGQDWLGYIIDEKQYYDSTFVYERLLCLNPYLGKRLIEAYRTMDFD